MRKLSAVHPLHSLVACMFHSNVSLQSFFSKEVGYGWMIRWLILGCWASRGLAVGGLWGSFSSCPYRFHISYILILYNEERSCWIHLNKSEYISQGSFAIVPERQDASSSFHVLRRFCCSGRVALHSKGNSLQDSCDKSGMELVGPSYIRQLYHTTGISDIHQIVPLRSRHSVSLCVSVIVSIKMHKMLYNQRQLSQLVPMRGLFIAFAKMPCVVKLLKEVHAAPAVDSWLSQFPKDSQTTATTACFSSQQW